MLPDTAGWDSGIVQTILQRLCKQMARTKRKKKPRGRPFEKGIDPRRLDPAAMRSHRKCEQGKEDVKRVRTLEEFAKTLHGAANEPVTDEEYRELKRRYSEASDEGKLMMGWELGSRTVKEYLAWQAKFEETLKMSNLETLRIKGERSHLSGWCPSCCGPYQMRVLRFVKVDGQPPRISAQCCACSRMGIKVSGFDLPAPEELDAAETAFAMRRS
jgi:hypothetical protein